MIPEAELMAGLVVLLEEELHEQGWDSIPPKIGLAVRTTNGMGAASIDLEIPERGGLNEALQETITLARLATPNINGDRTQLSAMCGLWLVMEVDPVETDEDRFSFVGDKAYRLAMLLDCAGRMHVVRRLRDGEVSGPVTLGAALSRVAMGGRTVEQIGDLLLEMAVWLPDDEVDLLAISRWGSRVEA